MFNHRVLAVIKRELKEKLFSKTFIVMTLIVHGLMLTILGVQALLMTSESKNLKIEIISETDQLTNAFQNEFIGLNLVKENKYIFSYSTLSKESLKDYLDQKKQALIDEKLGGIIFVPFTVMKNKKIEFY